MKTHTVALIAVDAIIADLTDRRGLKHEWYGIDEDIQKEIRMEWVGLVEDAMKNLVPANE